MNASLGQANSTTLPNDRLIPWTTKTIAFVSERGSEAFRDMGQSSISERKVEFRGSCGPSERNNEGGTMCSCQTRELSIPEPSDGCQHNDRKLRGAETTEALLKQMTGSNRHAHAWPGLYVAEKGINTWHIEATTPERRIHSRITKYEGVDRRRSVSRDLMRPSFGEAHTMVRRRRGRSLGNRSCT